LLGDGWPTEDAGDGQDGEKESRELHEVSCSTRHGRLKSFDEAVDARTGALIFRKLS
jgi:hypothetical protein